MYSVIESHMTLHGRPLEERTIALCESMDDACCITAALNEIGAASYFTIETQEIPWMFCGIDQAIIQ